MNFEIGITVFRQYGQLELCVKSILRGYLYPPKIWIIDNGRMLHRNIPFCHIITPDRNLGVATSWNLLMKVIHPCTAIICNDDLEADLDTFEELMEPASPALVTGHGFACFRIDPEIAAKVGQFDEAFYPAYYEDADYQRRCQLAGVEIIHLPSVVKRHGNDAKPYQGMTDTELQAFEKQVESNKQRFIDKWGGLPSDFF